MRARQPRKFARQAKTAPSDPPGASRDAPPYASGPGAALALARDAIATGRLLDG